MILIGSMSDEEERDMILLVTRVFVVEERIFEITKHMRNKNENNNKEKNK